MIQNKKIFITGGAGFIGTKLCKLLIENNEVLIYDNLKRNSIKDTNLLDKKNIKLVQGDILDYEFLQSIIVNFNPNIVIHMAAIAGIDTVIKNPIKTMEVNMIGTYNLLCVTKECMKYLERVIIFSTSEVFGAYAYKVDEESTANLAPVGKARWTYSVSKLAGEHLAHSYYNEYGMPVVIIRPFNIYGPGQIGEGAIHTFVVRAIQNQEMQIHGDGAQIRSWCYIEDFINGLVLCLEKAEAIGHTFNIGNLRGTVTISMLAELIKRISKSSSNIVYIPKNYEDVELRMPNIEKARKTLGYEPIYNLSEGLEKTIDWYRGVIK